MAGLQGVRETLEAMYDKSGHDRAVLEVANAWERVPGVLKVYADHAGGWAQPPELGEHQPYTSDVNGC